MLFVIRHGEPINDDQNTIFTQRRRASLDLFTFWRPRHNRLGNAGDYVTIDLKIVTRAWK